MYRPYYANSLFQPKVKTNTKMYGETHFDECENLAHTQRKFYIIKSMRELFETIDPNNNQLPGKKKKTASNQRYKSISQKPHLQLHTHTHV